jgi:hypothetical protein
VREHGTSAKCNKAEIMSHTAIPHPTQPVPEKDEYVGRFDEGQELEPEKDREQVGRFDDELRQD